MLHTIKLVSYNTDIVCLYMSLYMTEVPQEKKKTIFYSPCMTYACCYIHHVVHIKKIDLNYC